MKTSLWSNAVHAKPSHPDWTLPLTAFPFCIIDWGLDWELHQQHAWDLTKILDLDITADEESCLITQSDVIKAFTLPLQVWLNQAVAEIENCSGSVLGQSLRVAVWLKHLTSACHLHLLQIPLIWRDLGSVWTADLKSRVRENSSVMRKQFLHSPWWVFDLAYTAECHMSGHETLIAQSWMLLW